MLRGQRHTQKVRNAKEEKKRAKEEKNRLAEARKAALAASAAAAASAAPLGNSHMPSSSAHPFHANFNSLSRAAAAIPLPRSTRKTTANAARAASSTNIRTLLDRGESNSNDD